MTKFIQKEATMQKIESLDQFSKILQDLLKNEKLSSNNRKIIQYILLNDKSIAFMTASELSGKIGVSQPAITRFVSKVLNYPSFALFINEMKQLTRYEITSVERQSITSLNHLTTIETFIQQEIDNLQNLMKFIDAEQLEFVSKKITNASSILIMGTRTAAPLANYFYFFLRKIRPNVFILTTDGSNSYDILEDFKEPHALVVTFLFPRYPTKMVSILNYLEAQQFQYISIADSKVLENQGIGKISITTPITLNSLFDSYISTFGFLTILLNVISNENFGATKERLAKLEETYRTTNIFYTHFMKKGDSK